jgi:hypothetical protein
MQFSALISYAGRAFRGEQYIPRGVVTPGKAKQKKEKLVRAILWDNIG